MVTNPSFVQNLLIALAVGTASGSVGAFIVLKRMALVGDALSHIALPGIALALAYGVDPFWGVLVSVLIAAAIIWRLEIQTRLPEDAVVGLLFTASLAIGILTIPDTEIIESLFGAFPVLGLPMFLAVTGAAVLLTVLSFLLTQKFLFRVVSQDLAKVHSVGEQYNLVLLLIFVSVVALGIKLVGTLLMGALTIIPAATAKNLTRSMRGYEVTAATLGGSLSVIGVFIARSFHLLPGPSIILAGVFVFLCSLFFVRKH